MWTKAHQVILFIVNMKDFHGTQTCMAHRKAHNYDAEVKIVPLSPLRGQDEPQPAELCHTMVPSLFSELPLAVTS